MKAHSRPLIGITLDSEQPGGYSKFPWYALRDNYAGATAAAGGLPVALPHEPDAVGDYLDAIKGLIVTGGAFDVDPALFGAGEKHATVTTKDKRTAFELAILAGAAFQLLKHRLRFHPTIALLAAVIGWGGAQWLAGWSADAFRTQEELLNWTVRLAAFAWALSLDGHTRHRLLTAGVWFAAALAVVGMLTAFTSPLGTVFWTVDVGTGIATLDRKSTRLNSSH